MELVLSRICANHKFYAQALAKTSAPMLDLKTLMQTISYTNNEENSLTTKARIYLQGAHK